MRRLLPFAAACAALVPLAAPAARAQTLALRADTVYTMDGPPIVRGVVLVENGRIRAVGPARQVRIPAGWRVVEGRVATPGFVDARSTVGLSGMLNQRHDQDQLDAGGPLQPELRALDAYNPLDSLVGWLRAHGVTTVHTGHSAGALASGTMAIFKTAGLSADEAAVAPEAMVAMSLGEEISSTFSSPGTRAKSIAMLRSELLRAQTRARRPAGASGARAGGRSDRLTAADAPAPARAPADRLAGADTSRARPSGGAAGGPEDARDLRQEALVALLRGERTALVTAHRAQDLLGALRLQREFGFRMVLDGAAEAYLVLDQIRAAGVPVFVHPTMLRAGGGATNLSMETAARLDSAGIPFAFTSSYEPYVPKTRVVGYEAAVAVGQGGLPRMRALHALTAGAARLLGLERRVGRLAPGLDADVVLWSGDPFEYATRTCATVIDGRLVHQDAACR